MKPLLSLKNVSIRIPNAKHSVLLENANCHVNVGEMMAIIGPNGAGKSSLMKAISGDIDYQGEIKMDGASSDPKLRARQLAVLPQLSLLNFPYRVSEVVALARIPHATGAVRDKQIVQAALALMDADYLHDRLYTELSGGERQRVQLARVLAQIWQAEDAPNNSRVLLLDEPTTALDLGHQQLLMRALRKIAAAGVSIVMVLHDVNLAAQYADTMLALLCSQQHAFGPTKSVITTENIQTLFGIETKIISHPDTNAPVIIGL